MDRFRTRWYLPVELLRLDGDLELDTFLLCYHCRQRHVSTDTKAAAMAKHTEIVDVEDTADGTARPPVPGFALRRRGWSVVNGRVNLAQRRCRFLHFSGHGGVAEVGLKTSLYKGCCYGLSALQEM